MENLIKDILTFSKISAEKDPFVDTDLNEVMDEVLLDLKDEIIKKSASISVDKLPKISVNPGLIRPLFYNLISNALKYSKPQTAPEVRIRSEINNLFLSTNGIKEEQNYCRIIVDDNGIGFDQKYAEQIFGMFKRLHRQAEFEGTGIGLALCKKIVEEHNGFISALSKVNEGSSFIVTLPVKQVPKEALVVETNDR